MSGGRSVRVDPVTGDVCVVAPARALRPGRASAFAPLRTPPAQCPFCPGHEAYTPDTLAAVHDAEGWRVRAFPNRYPAMVVEDARAGAWEAGFPRGTAPGAHEVIVEGRVHDLPVWAQPGLGAAALGLARARMADLRQDRRLIARVWFRNQGRLAGASQEHPHAQLLALPVVPPRLAAMVTGMAAFATTHGVRWAEAVVQDARRSGRLVAEVGGVAVITPHAPRFSFEVWFVPPGAGPAFEDADEATVAALADAMDRGSAALAALLDRPDTTAALHTAPTSDAAALLPGAPSVADVQAFCWHARLAPRLTALAGLEVTTGAHLVSVGPEEAAEALRRVWSENDANTGPAAM